MKTTYPSTWIENNQKYLVACIEQLKIKLQGYGHAVERNIEPKMTDATSYNDNDIHKNNNNNDDENPFDDTATNTQEIFAEWSEEGSLPALETLSRVFGLSSFERSIVLLCAGIELDADFARLCAQVQGRSTTTYPTFGLAMSIFPNAHWSAITPASPLRYYRLIELLHYHDNPPSLATLSASSIRIDERVLHYLTGISYIEPQLYKMIRPLRETIPVVVDSHRLTIEQILKTSTNSKARLPIINLWGIDNVSKKIIAQQVCSELELTLWELYAPEFAFLKSAEDIELFRQLWVRESLLQEGGLYIALDDLESSQQKVLVKLLEGIATTGTTTATATTDGILRPIFLSSRDRLYNELIPTIEVKKPTKSEQLYLWKSFLGNDDPSRSVFSLYSSDSSTGSSIPPPQISDQELKKLVNEFDMDASSILSASYEVATMFSQNNNSNFDVARAAWNASLSITRSKIAELELVQRITSQYTMEDLILPEREKQLLRDIAIHVRQRGKIFEEWGFSSSSRGIGIVALFCGASGVGKTMAAEVLANELQYYPIDLYRIDLSSIVSKWLGETEKNLRKVFDACENGGAILFFDEADSLFGKRTEVRDAHDRYANIEINYLLQRMESYRGLAILATNMKSAIDPAFMRRFQFVIDFQFPDEKYREQIWKRIFPKTAAIDNKSVDFHRLARLNTSGANIRNIAIYAAFLAADESVPINIKHIKHAAQVEYAKMDRPLVRDEVLGEEL
jgi:SpoVK/Ycf46/Vps4 family AAA+-type ATPase